MYSYSANIRFSETDSDLNLSILGLVNYFQDAAIFEAENGKINMDYLGERHLAWLLSSWQIVINRMPHLNEKVIITTIPYEFRGFMGYRNFIMKSEQGEVLSTATSIWTLVDIEQVKPVRPTQEILNGYEISEKLDMEYKPRKIKLSGNRTEKEAFAVHKSQIDSNHHVNNAEYVRMALDYLPEGSRITELRVEYKTSAYLGELIHPVVYEEPGCVQISLNKEKQETYAVVEFSYIQK